MICGTILKKRCNGCNAFALSSMKKEKRRYINLVQVIEFLRDECGVKDCTRLFRKNTNLCELCLSGWIRFYTLCKRYGIKFEETVFNFPELAHRIVAHRNVEKPFLALVDEIGVDKATSIAQSYPWLLSLSDIELRKRFGFFAKQGVSAMQLVNSAPLLLRQTSEHVRERMETFSALGLDVGKLSKKPISLTYSVASVKLCMRRLEQLGGDPVKILNRHPTIAGSRIEALDEMFAMLRNYGFSTDRIMENGFDAFVRRQSEVMATLDVFGVFGFTKTDVITIINQVPYFIGTSPKKLSGVLGLCKRYVHEAHFKRCVLGCLHGLRVSERRLEIALIIHREIAGLSLDTFFINRCAACEPCSVVFAYLLDKDSVGVHAEFFAKVKEYEEQGIALEDVKALSSSALFLPILTKAPG